MFAFSFVICFGISLEEFKSFGESVLGNTNLFLGESYLDEMRSSDRSVGLLLWIIVIIIGATVLMNIFINVVGNVYEERIKLCEREYIQRVNRLMTNDVWARYGLVTDNNLVWSVLKTCLRCIRR